MTETVLVKGWAKDDSHKDGVVINKADFDPAVHKLFSDSVIESDFLDRTAAKILEDLPAVTDDELAIYLDQEKAGKNRAGVVSAIEKEVATRAGAAE